jgi:hypothetical protein
MMKRIRVSVHGCVVTNKANLVPTKPLTGGTIDLATYFGL